MRKSLHPLLYMTELYLVRHGETEENVQHILQGHLPGTLTARGIAQAETLRDELLSCGVRFDALVCSDLRRAVHTAEIVNAPLALSLHPIRLLRERDWGSLTGTVVQPDHHVDIPSDAESVEEMFRRARIFLEWVEENYAGQRIIAVGHGLFNRVLQAALKGLTIRDIPRMENAEVRVLQINGHVLCASAQGEIGPDSVSAN